MNERTERENEARETAAVPDERQDTETRAVSGMEGDDAEFGGELAARTDVPTLAPDGEASERPSAGPVIGLIAIVAAILSFFMFRGVLGPAAAVVGFMAYASGSKALGVWSMLLGLISFVMFLLSLQQPAVY